MKIPSYLYDFKFPGVYCIENSINHKRYIGSSKNIYSRLHAHRAKLVKNKHENIILQNSVNKRGIDIYECYLIEIVEDENLLTEREQYWLNKLIPEYNLTKEVIRNVLSTQSRIQISNTLKEGYASGRIIFTHTSPIDMYDLEGNFIKSFPRIRECAREMNLHATSIIRVLKGQYFQCKGYQFRYSWDKDKIMKKVTRSKYNTQYKRKLADNKQGELLENPGEDNQQPSLSSNTLEGSTTNSQVLTSNVEDSNGNTSALQLEIVDDIV